MTGPLFIVTPSDVVALVVVACIVVTAVVGLVVTLAKQALCKHSRVFENRACDVVCRKCGKNLGFIGSYRKDKQP